MLDEKRHWFQKIEKVVGRIFSFLPFHPNDYTLFSVFLAFFSFYFLTQKKIILSLFFFSLSAFCDFVDGAIARYKNIPTKKGAYLDTICDRYVEGFLLLGMIFLPLPKVIFPATFWIFLILFGGMMTTYAKAAAKEKELVFSELKGGLLSRGERIILLIISLFLGIFNFLWMSYLLVFIAIFTNITAIQRILSALKKSQN